MQAQREAGLKVELGNATLYHGDCREILTGLPMAEALITDPVWPNCPPGLLQGADDPHGLFQGMWEACESPARAVIVMRNDQDPRFLTSVPLPFLQVMWLRYAAVGYIGRFLSGNDCAYAFGEWPSSRPGRRVLPAMSPVESQPVSREEHPCPRSLTHMKFLVENWSDTEVLDPFMGQGTTGEACAYLGRRFIGIEIDELYFELACRRIEQAQKQGRMFA